MRTKVDWRSGSNDNYKDFRKKNPDINLSLDEWRNIVYTFYEEFRNYVLETGERAKLPQGFGDFTISKKKRRRIKYGNGREFINLPVDWKKTREKGKIIYNFNFHTEGYFFGWMWFKKEARFKFAGLWRFKPSRVSSRMIAHYIKSDNKYQHIYRQWKH